MMQTRRKSGYVLIALLLTACGQMGPLYLPDQPPPIHTPTSYNINK